MNTSLKKSHSRVSNLKLTLSCLLNALAITSLWIIIASYNNIDKLIANIMIIVSSLVIVVLAIILHKFKR